MKCYFCDKHLLNYEATEFICICDNCLSVLEANESRLVKKIGEQQERITELVNEFERWQRSEET